MDNSDPPGFIIDFYITPFSSGSLTVSTGSYTTGTYTVGIPITSDKDWMPYRHFEYEPLWHKKYAAIKYQMKTMWD